MNSRKKFVSANLYEIKKARVVFRARNFEKAKIEMKNIIENGQATGDVFYYYGYCLYTVDNDKKEAFKYFNKAINWFLEYKSEFSEDDNFDKSIYNLGILFYKGKQIDLLRVKKIWDFGLKQNKNNEYINKEYQQLQDQILFGTLFTKANSFMKELDACSSAADIEQVKSKYSEVFSKYTIEEIEAFKGIMDDQINFVTKVITEFDNLISEKLELLGSV
jgi:tetratricopeptide (TPR) repeat protein